MGYASYFGGSLHGNSGITRSYRFWDLCEWVQTRLQVFRGVREYIIVHEMTYLLEPTHNARFMALMDQFIPNWRVRRDLLNQLPVSHEDWHY